MKRFHQVSILAVLFTLAASLQAADKSLTVSVRGQVAPDYQRQKLPDGKFKAERYVISNGGKFPGTTTDGSMEKVTYPEVAGMVARHLASQQYYLAKKASDADLLIAIYWGETIPFNNVEYANSADKLATVLRDATQATLADRTNAETGEIRQSGGAQGVDTGALESAMARIEMANQMRDAANLGNAKILGYLDDINERRDMIPWTDIGNKERDLVADVEEDRYYIVVRAYDFKALRNDGKQVVRWTTRISIGSQGNAFDERFSQMVAAAAKSFGQKQGLRRQFYGDPLVELGELKFLGETTVPSAQDTSEAAAKK